MTLRQCVAAESVFLVGLEVEVQMDVSIFTSCEQFAHPVCAPPSIDSQQSGSVERYQAIGSIVRQNHVAGAVFKVVIAAVGRSVKVAICSYCCHSHKAVPARMCFPGKPDRKANFHQGRYLARLCAFMPHFLNLMRLRLLESPVVLLQGKLPANAENRCEDAI